MAQPRNRYWAPVGNDFFDLQPLSDREKKYLIRKGCEAAQEVVERARSTGGPIHWRHVDKYQGVQIYTGHPKNASSNNTGSMCGVTSIRASIREISSLFAISTTKEMKKFSQEFPELYYDGLVLYHLTPRSLEKPMHQVTAKWIISEVPAENVEDRDFCYLECQDRFVDSYGRKGWVLSLHSIKLPGARDLSVEYGIVRGSFYHSGIVVIESDRPGFVEVIHLLQMNLKNGAFLSLKALRQRVAFVGRINDMLQKKRLHEQRYLNDLELIPKRLRSRCAVCSDSFGLLLLRKMNCRKCGDVVCGACSKEFKIEQLVASNSPGQAREKVILKLRICVRCFTRIATGKSSNGPQGHFGHSNRFNSGEGTFCGSNLLEYFDDNQRASFLTELPDSAAHMAAQLNRQNRIFLQSYRESSSSSSSSSSKKEQRPPLRASAEPKRSVSSNLEEKRDSGGAYGYGYASNGPCSSLDKTRMFKVENSKFEPRHATSIFDRAVSMSAEIPPPQTPCSEYGLDTINIHYSRYGFKNNQPPSYHDASNQPVLENQEYMNMPPLESFGIPPASHKNFNHVYGSNTNAVDERCDSFESQGGVEELHDGSLNMISNNHEYRSRRDSSGSDTSSTGSVDIDSYQVGTLESKKEDNNRGSIASVTLLSDDLYFYLNGVRKTKNNQEEEEVKAAPRSNGSSGSSASSHESDMLELSIDDVDVEEVSAPTFPPQPLPPTYNEVKATSAAAPMPPPPSYVPSRFASFHREVPPPPSYNTATNGTTVPVPTVQMSEMSMNDLFAPAVGIPLPYSKQSPSKAAPPPQVKVVVQEKELDEVDPMLLSARNLFQRYRSAKQFDSLRSQLKDGKNQGQIEKTLQDIQLQLDTMSSDSETSDTE